jgi:hypothetical protein
MTQNVVNKENCFGRGCLYLAVLSGSKPYKLSRKPTAMVT